MKNAIVTGAARGIGLATTKLFLKEGRRVAMIDRDGEELARAAAGLDNVLPITCDVSVEAQVAAMVAQVAEAFGSIDALVNNAGVADFRPMCQTELQILRTFMATCSRSSISPSDSCFCASRCHPVPPGYPGWHCSVS